MKRENGYYWVKYKDFWHPALYAKNNTWFIINAFEGICETELDEVGLQIKYCEYCFGVGQFKNSFGEYVACNKCGCKEREGI
jgi:hypothetical protein